MKSIRTITSLATAGVIGFALAAGPVRAQDAQTQGISSNEIRIGSYGPFAGPVYMYGKLAMNGVEAVFDKVNEAGGVHGRKLVLVREDDACKPEGAIAAVKKLAYDAKVFAIIGGACSNSTLASVPELEKSGIPMVVNSAVADAISDPVRKNIYTTMITSSVESRAQVDYALAKGAKKIAVVRMTDAWAMARWNPLEAYLKAKGITLVEDLELGVDANDATPQALKLKASGADAVIMVLYPKPAAVLIRDSLKIGGNPLWVGQTAINDFTAFDKQVGVPGALARFATITSTAYQPTDPEMKDWADRLKKLFPNDELSTFNMNGIGSAQVLVEGLERAGKDLTRDKFLAAMGTIKNFNVDAYAGTITCDSPKSHQCNQSPGWLVLKDGKVVREK
jgi:branched-chain amino acid transport system substrate-binding protein